jgi:Excreted virulence factor EspC, type VII ESX diderm
MAGGGQFTVDPEALHRAASAFDDAAAGLAGAVNGFMASSPSAEAFGLLPQARSAYGRYVAKLGEAQDGLRSVHQAFERSLAGGLRANAANYVRADQDSMAR